MSKQLVSVLILTLSALAGAGCRSDSDDPAGASPKPVPAQSFAREWAVQLDVEGKNSLSEIHVRDNTIFLYSKNHYAYAINRTSGQLEYYNQVTSPQVKLWPPVVLPDRVVFPIAAGLEMYNLRGRKIGSINLDYTFRGPATGAEGRVYVGTNSGSSGGGRVGAIDVTRQYSHVRWELMTFGPVSSAPALHAGVLYIGAEDGRIYAVSALDRGAQWSIDGGVFPTFGSIRADVKADEFGVYAASTDSKLYCVDRNNAKVKWQYFSGAELTTSPVVTEKIIYQAVPGKGVAAINKSEGKFNREALWVAKGAVQFLAADEKFAYLRGRDNVVIAVDARTGEAAFKSKRADFDLFGTNTRNDGIIYAATSNGQVIAIRPVLKPGSMGELVLVPTSIETLALAN